MNPLDEFAPRQLLQRLIGIKKSRVADVADHLQRGDEGVVFEGAPENSELDRIVIAKVHAGVAPGVAFFDVLEHFLRVILVAVASRPALELTLGAAGEDEQLVPIALDEVENPGDGSLLTLFILPEPGAVDVDVQAAGGSLMGAVFEVDGLIHDLAPRDGGNVIVQRHRVGDNLETVIERTVVFAIDVLSAAIGDIHQLFCDGIVFARTVDLQLDAEVTAAVAVEDGRGLVVIFVNCAAAELVVAVAAVGKFLIVVGVEVVRGFFRDERSAAGADGVVVLTTVGAERGVGISCVFIAQDRIAAVLAADSELVETVGAVEPVAEGDELFVREQRTAGEAWCGGHEGYLHK